jgi:CheY-like chemotaxis protein
MNSVFYYPTNTGSLGEARRPQVLGSPAAPRHFRFETERDGLVKKRNVLVVEDDENTVFLLKNLLGSRGYQVVPASDGKQALEITKTLDLDLVLLDLQLPRLNGLSVIRQLREDSRFECLPIIIMTGYEPEQYRGTAIEAGCDDFLLKPIDLDRLDAILDYFAPIKVAAIFSDFLP